MEIGHIVTPKPVLLGKQPSVRWNYENRRRKVRSRAIRMAGFGRKGMSAGGEMLDLAFDIDLAEGFVLRNFEQVSCFA